jgi:hypothetical protein
LTDFFADKKHLRKNSGSISSRCAAGCGKIRQTRRAAISLHFNVLGRLQIEPLLAARPKPLKFREIAAEHIESMGPEPKVRGRRELTSPQSALPPFHLKNAAYK